MARRGSKFEDQIMSMARAKTQKYDDHKGLIHDFLTNYQSNDKKDHTKTHGRKKYLGMLQRIVDREQHTVWLDLGELEAYFREKDEDDLVEQIKLNASRYLDFCYDACIRAMPDKSPSVHDDEVEDWYRKVAENNPESEIPPHVKCKFQVRLVPGAVKPRKLREIKSADVGSLVTLQGTVTRCSPVRPKVEVCTYQCSVCLRENYQVIDKEQYTPVHECASEECEGNKVAGLLHACLASSKLVRCQDLRLQEAPGEVPTGTVPRMTRVLLLGDNTRKCVPGDRVTITGVFVPVKETGFKQMKKGPMIDVVLEAHWIEKEKQGSVAIPQDMQDKLLKESHSHDMYERLAASMAPEIFGHEDVKKALLLMLVGGVNKHLEDGMKLRGDMHMLLMGDPGVAKSQLIKHVCQIAPRAVYTSGKGSSSVGLTAAIVKDSNTGEVTLEGGALVMADNGVCAIDEFDKMDESDRTAIHEVMEQQTVSIAKAGITTSLNARASLICAANPAYGRYNMRKSPVQNINLPDSLLSRFDLTWVLIDKVDAEKDFQLARHVGHVHKHKAAPDEDLGRIFNELEMRQFISLARDKEPKIDEALQYTIINTYAQLRSDESNSSDDAERFSYTTPRTLLAMLRLSQARARLRLNDTVELSDFEEAQRLILASKESAMEDPEDDSRRRVDAESQIYTLIRQQCEKKPGEWLKRTELERMITLKGFKADQLDETIQVYVAVDVFEQSDDRARLRLVE